MSSVPTILELLAQPRAKLSSSVVCRLCGKEFGALQCHLVRTHQVSSDEYRDEFPGASIVSETFRVNCALRTLRRWRPEMPVTFRYRTYDEAKVLLAPFAFDSVLSYKEWWQATHGHRLPRLPRRHYVESWVSWADYLGTDVMTLRETHEQFAPFQEAREYARSLKLSSVTAWREWAKSGQRPTTIPWAPHKVYEEDWQGWPDFLNTDTLRQQEEARSFVAYEEAKAFTRKKKFSTIRDWQRWAESPERPVTMPADPKTAYKDRGWEGWSQFLGTEIIDSRARHKQFLGFRAARALVRRQGLRSQVQYERWRKESAANKLPVDPRRTYARDGWRGWRDFLGSRFLPFEHARAHVQKIGLRSKKEYDVWHKSGRKNLAVPAAPDQAYRNEGWVSWGDFLGCEPHCGRDFLPFEEARAYVRALGLRSQAEFTAWYKSDQRPLLIPTAPHVVYKDRGWVSLPDFLGYAAKEPLLPFEEARDYVQSLELQSAAEHRDWCRAGQRPANIPYSPDVTYRNSGWISWPDYLGYDSREMHLKRLGFPPYEQARAIIEENGIFSRAEYHKWVKADPETRLPVCPSKCYRQKWTGWEDYLPDKDAQVQELQQKIEALETRLAQLRG